MNAPFWSGEKSRRVVRRIVVETELRLRTPAHFGGGDGDDLTDMPLLCDGREPDRPVLTGASLAGALRGYLRSVEQGYRSKSTPGDLTELLFGAIKQSEREESVGKQSPLIIDDALAKKGSYAVEVRAGVRINSCSRTAEHNALFDMQLWAAGTTFPLRFELVVCLPPSESDLSDYERRLKQAFATALQGLKSGAITLGARKNRGYGEIAIGGWKFKMYDLTKAAELLDWLENGNLPLTGVSEKDNIYQSLGVNRPESAEKQNKRNELIVHADLAIAGEPWTTSSSLLIRGEGDASFGADMIHLHGSHETSQSTPLLPGTSLAGALRARAEKIANTLVAHGSSSDKPKRLVENIFGPEMRSSTPTDQKCASRLLVRERPVTGVETELIQHRVSIDRFTAGARDTALFNEQPLLPRDNSQVKISLRLQKPENCEIGLLLLTIKDLCTGDLPLGGEANVGRGRMQAAPGGAIEITKQQGGASKTWRLATDDGETFHLPDDFEELENHVDELITHLNAKDTDTESAEAHNHEQTNH